MAGKPIHEQDNAEFLAVSTRELQALFDEARCRNEFQFLLALFPSFAGACEEDWYPDRDIHDAISDFTAFLQEDRPGSLKVRVSLCLYCQLSEGAGYHKVPKNLMRVLTGLPTVPLPFLKQNEAAVDRYLSTKARQLAKSHSNSRSVSSMLVEHARGLNRPHLAAVFADIFDHELRHAFAHADYVIADVGIRLRDRDGAKFRTVPWSELELRLNRALTYFHSLLQIMESSKGLYKGGRVFRARDTAGVEREYIATTDQAGVFKIESRD